MRAYLVFLRLLGRWGRRAPRWWRTCCRCTGIVLGALVLSEPVDARLIVGTVLVIAGIALVKARWGSRALFDRRKAAVAEPRG